MHSRTFHAVLLATVLAAACSSTPKGIRRLPRAYEIDAASAGAAAEQGDWLLAASRWYEIYLRDDAEAVRAGVETARSLVAARQIRSAREFLETAIVEHRDQSELLEAYANVLVLSGFRRAAEPYFERAIDLDPDRRSAMLALARVQVELKHFTSASEWLQRRLDLGASDAETWSLLASARRGQGRPLEAFAAHEKAFELGEARADRLVFAATAFLELPGDERTPLRAASAERWLRRALELEPREPLHFEALGRLREATGQIDAALECYRAALAVAPAHVRSGLRLAELLAGRGERAAASAVLEALLPLVPDAELAEPVRERLRALHAADQATDDAPRPRER